MYMLTDLIDKIRLDNNCVVYPPTHLPSIPEGFDLPMDVIEFYHLCGGIEIYCKSSSLGFRIMTADEVTQVNPLIIGELYEEDISSQWFAIAQDGNGNYISIDFSRGKKNGFCYDSSVECHGLAGDCAIVSKCFTDLLNSLYQNKGTSVFWIEPDFQYLGDAYAE